MVKKKKKKKKKKLCLPNARDIRDAGSILGLGRTPERGNGNPLCYSCLGNPMDREPWQATVHGVAKIRTQATSHACIGYTHFNK